MTNLLVIGAAVLSAMLGSKVKIGVEKYACSPFEYYVQMEEAPVRTKCYVDSGSAEAVKKVGVEYFSETAYVESSSYSDSSVLSKTKYTIMKADNVNPSKEVREPIAEKFCEYIFSLC